MRKKWSAIRRYLDGTVDDVAIDSNLFRLEQMTDKAFWACAYRGEKRAMFWIEWNEEQGRLIATCYEDSIGCTDDSSPKRYVSDAEAEFLSQKLQPPRRY